MAISTWLSWLAGQLSLVAFQITLGNLHVFHTGCTTQTMYFYLNSSYNTCCLLCVTHRVTKRPPTPQKRWPSRTPQPSTHLPHRMVSPQSLRHHTRFQHRTTLGKAGFLSTLWPSTRPHRHTASQVALTTARLPSPPPRPHRSVSFITCKQCLQHTVEK